MLYDHELEEAVQLCHRLYENGVDALIIQDMGLLESDLPPIPLFASTQVHNHTPEKVSFLEKVGFQRVILARELSLQEIANIRAATSVELETFIHGALCVSYSGQCALSYAIGGRSGNRGQCAQPCRLHYTLVDQHDNPLVENQHLLSLKDLNLTDHLHDLISAGICSFKIEGRLKDQVYVKNIVSHYRQRLDEILPDLGMRTTSSGRTIHHFQPDPEKTFNRGYTNYYLTGVRDRIASPETPKHAGEPVGVVTHIGKKTFRLNVKPSLNNGDGLTFFHTNGKLMGTFVNQVEGSTITPAQMDGIQIGTQIRRNADRLFLKQVENSNNERKIPILLRFSDTDSGFQLLAQDHDGNKVKISIDHEKIAAQKPKRLIEVIRRQFNRLGASEFSLEALDIDLSHSYFIPVSTLNRIRREMVTQLQQERLENFPRWERLYSPNQDPFPQENLTYLGNVLNRKAAIFYHRHGVEQIEPAAESGLEMKGRKVMTTKHCLKYEFGACPHQTNRTQFDEPLYLVKDDGLRLRLKFNCRLCLMEIYFENSNN